MRLRKRHIVLGSYLLVAGAMVLLAYRVATYAGNVLLLLVIGGLLYMLWNLRLPVEYWPSRPQAISAMMELACATGDDRVCELGCGDSRILVQMVAKTTGPGVGIEADPVRVLISKLRVWGAGLSHRIRIIRGDVFAADLSQADVVAAYLNVKVMDELRDKFFQTLPRGARIVSNGHRITGWPLSDCREIGDRSGSVVYLYNIDEIRSHFQASSAGESTPC